MKTYFYAILVVLCLTLSAVAQNTNSNTSTKTTATNSNTNSSATNKRPPVFRATKDQISQAQTMLKQKNMYAGEVSGKLDDATRAGLKKYQEAEGLSVTGTLNRVTLEKMNIQLTEAQMKIPIPAEKPKDTASGEKTSSSSARFRATKDQIMQAQKMLKDKGLYAGETDGKMNDDFRAALRKYQETEKLKVTGTLSRETVEKMGIPLTDKQKTAAMPTTK